MQPLFLILLPALLLAVMSQAHAGTRDLTSDQQRTFKDAEYYMKDVDRRVPKILAAAEAFESGDNAPSEVAIERQLNEVRLAGLVLEKVTSRLQQLPGTDAQVAALTQRSNEAGEKLLGAVESLSSARKAITGVDTTEIAAETKKMRQFHAAVSQDGLLQSHPLMAAVTVRELTHMQAERDSLVERYSALFGDTRGRDLGAAIDGFDRQLPSYREAMSRAAAMLPETVEKEIQVARDLAARARELGRAGAFANGGIDGRFAQAEAYADLLEAIVGKSEVKAVRRTIAAGRKELDAARAALESEIIASNVAPNDVYSGGDKAELIERILAKFKKSNPKAKVLGARVPMRNWERRAGWRWAGDRYQIHDESDLQIAIGVSVKDQVHVYYAHLLKDHLKGDKVTFRIDDRGEVALHRRLPANAWR